MLHTYACFFSFQLSIEYLWESPSVLVASAKLISLASVVSIRFSSLAFVMTSTVTFATSVFTWVTAFFTAPSSILSTHLFFLRTLNLFVFFFCLYLDLL